ncbi:MAG TPA: hypothetical protein VKM93_17460 [Terriglobia bacterium]|nr:hypothetical protein [Terriglobia bacterium]
MSKPSQVIVVLEDDHHEMLIYRYLVNCGLKRYAIRIHRSPSGQGSAEGWVRKTFVRETNVYRSRQARALTALIVMIDADTRTVQERWNQLDETLTESGNPIVGEGERIARLVPRRNVETWILCLNGQAVDEETDYKRAGSDWNKLIPTASETLYQWTRSPAEPRDHCVSSLRTGVRELKRLRP